MINLIQKRVFQHMYGDINVASFLGWLFPSAVASAATGILVDVVSDLNIYPFQSQGLYKLLVPPCLALIWIVGRTITDPNKVLRLAGNYDFPQPPVVRPLEKILAEIIDGMVQIETVYIQSCSNFFNSTIDLSLKRE
ncbi:hypothetical protein ROG8370_03944 [Roseovarius gaetbuli]|uniref:Uncharacterized protein n=1 Tax=Roseovarius gaetbuli TaxID=1356575 RepID=A0A1X7ADZ9_9RHOB|nr:hypothetical protein ROG8370_03944 [Roseovarius gaetbuli]